MELDAKALPARARLPAVVAGAWETHRRLSLCETLDRLLGRGAVIAGDIVISIADVDLVYVGLEVVVASVETVRTWTATSRRRNLPASGARPAPRVRG